LTLTFDRAIRHIVLHQSSTSTYIPNFIQIEETFCGRTDVRTDISPLYIIRSTLGSRPNNKHIYKAPCMPTDSCRGAKITYNVLSGTLNFTIPYYTIPMVSISYK